MVDGSLARTLLATSSSAWRMTASWPLLTRMIAVIVSMSFSRLAVALSPPGGAIIGLGIGFQPLHAVEEQPPLACHVVSISQMQNGLAALLDRADRGDAALAHHRGVHIGGRGQG